MKMLKILGVLALVYVGLVAVLESAVGYLQPDMTGGVRLTTTDPDGRPSARMLAGFRLDGKLYVSSNHWLRGWYRRALENPTVEVTVNGESREYRAVPIQGGELERVADAYTMGFVLRLMCGFAPSRFLRLDPR